MPTKNPPPNRPPSRSPSRPSHRPEAEDDDVMVLERQPEQITPPPMYQVVLLNDDFTPMDFVIEILQDIFGKDHKAATDIMLRVHHEGRAVCGVYSRDVATSKVAQVLQAAQSAGHPLQAVAEPMV